MQNENFDLTKINDINLSVLDARTYIDKYFIPLDDGTHAILKNGVYKIVDTAVLKSTYFNRMSKQWNKYYFTEKTDIRTIIYDLNKPILSATELNLCPRKKHLYKPYKDFTDDIKRKVGIMLFHLKDVLCDSQEDIYQFLLKWLANAIRGNKNNSCVYLKGPQGTGKTTVFDFIRYHVIGDELCVETGSGPLKTKFNSELAGKLFVLFEELENFSSAEWISISSVLKRNITGKTIMIEAKGVNPVKHDNINNYVLLSNNDAIQDDDGRRYFIVPMSSKRIGDTKYFDNLYKNCFNDAVGHAMFCYLHEIDLTNYNAQKYPVTDAKLDSVAKRLDNVYKFLKDDYVLKSIGINKMLLSGLYKEYIDYCTKHTQKIKGKIDFNAMLKQVGIESYKSNGNNVYNVPKEELKAISDKLHWVHRLDSDRHDICSKVTINIFSEKGTLNGPKDEDYEYGIVKTETKESQYKQLLDLYEIQKNVVKSIMNNKDTLNKKPIEQDVSLQELIAMYNY